MIPKPPFGTKLIAFAALTMLSLAASAFIRPDRPATAPLAWRDLEGRTYGAPNLAKAKATVFFFTSTQCPLSNTYSPRMIELAKVYGARGVRFFLVDSNHEDAASVLQKDVKL